MTKIEIIRVSEKPDYMPLARHMADRIREFYDCPENVREFNEWKKRKEEQRCTNT